MDLLELAKISENVAKAPSISAIEMIGDELSSLLVIYRDNDRVMDLLEDSVVVWKKLMDLIQEKREEVVALVYRKHREVIEGETPKPEYEIRMPTEITPMRGEKLMKEIRIKLIIIAGNLKRAKEYA